MRNEKRKCQYPGCKRLIHGPKRKRFCCRAHQYRAYNQTHRVEHRAYYQLNVTRITAEREPAETKLRGLSNTQLGVLAEEIVRTDLKMRGFHLIPQSAHSRVFDIGAVKEDRFFRIEVRTGRKYSSGVLWAPHRRRDQNRSDVYVLVVFSQHLICYMGMSDLPGDRLTEIEGEWWWSICEDVPRRRTLRLRSARSPEVSIREADARLHGVQSM